jgi:hypothetical protein
MALIAQGAHQGDDIQAKLVLRQGQVAFLLRTIGHVVSSTAVAHARPHVQAQPMHPRQRSNRPAADVGRPQFFPAFRAQAIVNVQHSLGRRFRGTLSSGHPWLLPASLIGRLPHFPQVNFADVEKNDPARLFDATLQEARHLGLIPATSRLAAIDSAGLESHHVSHHFIRRCGRHRAHDKARYRPPSFA